MNPTATSDHQRDSVIETLRHPSAFVPILMSLLALSLVLLQIARHGTAPQPDEGAAAHLWQLLMALQLPVIVFFAIRWFPKSPRSAVLTLAFQLLAGIAAAAPVYYLHW